MLHAACFEQLSDNINLLSRHTFVTPLCGLSRHLIVKYLPIAPLARLQPPHIWP